jgi:hypothetical protein
MFQFQIGPRSARGRWSSKWPSTVDFVSVDVQKRLWPDSVRAGVPSKDLRPVDDQVDLVRRHRSRALDHEQTLAVRRDVVGHSWRVDKIRIEHPHAADPTAAPATSRGQAPFDPVSRFANTAATLLLAQGVDRRTIMETLGHWQISLTLNTYTGGAVSASRVPERRT